MESKEFDSGVRVITEVFGEINCPEAPSAKLLEEAVLANLLAKMFLSGTARFPLAIL